jgi:hypothetical protein
MHMLLLRQYTQVLWYRQWLPAPLYLGHVWPVDKCDELTIV